MSLGAGLQGGRDYGDCQTQSRNDVDRVLDCQAEGHYWRIHNKAAQQAKTKVAQLAVRTRKQVSCDADIVPQHCDSLEDASIVKFTIIVIIANQRFPNIMTCRLYAWTHGIE